MRQYRACRAQNYVRWREAYLLRGDVDVPAQTRHTIVVEQIPPPLRSDTALRAHFEALFPGQVHSALVHLELPEVGEWRLNGG